MAKNRRSRRRTLRPPKVPRPSHADAAVAKTSTPESRARRMQRLADGAVKSMLSPLDSLLEEEELGFRGLEFLDAHPTETENPLDDPLFRDWLLYFGAGPNTESSQPHFYDTVAARYLERGLGSPQRRSFIDLARRQPLSFWRVEEVGPGPWLQLADMLWLREHRVYAPRLVEEVPRGHALLAHVVADDEVAVLAVHAEEHFGPVAQYAIRQLAERAAPSLDGLPGLAAFGNEILELYDAWLLGDDPLTMPMQKTLEGHPTVMIHRRLSYPGRSLEDLLTILRSEPEFEADAAADAEDPRVAVGWNAAPLDGGEPFLPHGVFGLLHVTDEAVSARSTSAARFDALQARLVELLGPPAEIVTLEEETPDDGLALLEQLVEGHGQEPEQPIEIADDDLATMIEQISLEEAREMVRTAGEVDVALAEHFLAWPDVPNPVLDDRTPREVVVEPQGAERVRALVDAWERRAHHLDLSYQDFAALRADLGLPQIATTQGERTMQTTVPLVDGTEIELEIHGVTVHPAGEHAGEIELQASAPATSAAVLAEHLMAAVEGEGYRRPARGVDIEEGRIAIHYEAPPMGERVAMPEEVELVWIANPERRLGTLRCRRG